VTLFKTFTSCLLLLKKKFQQNIKCKMKHLLPSTELRNLVVSTKELNHLLHFETFRDIQES